MADKKYSQKIVTLGGGTGHYTLLRGLVKYNDPQLITAIPGTWDNGGSSGRLRDEFGVLPPGDTRKCLLALMEDAEQVKVAQKLFDDRLAEMSGPLQGHSLGNLILTRLDHIYHGQDRAIEAMRKLFRIQGQVKPVTLTNMDLMAKTAHGIEIVGETNIDYRKKRDDFDPGDRIVRVYFGDTGEANPEAIRAIKDAEKIVFAPGDLFTSVLPHLVISDIKEAILESQAKVYFVLNIMTKPGETDGFKASDHLKALLYYLGNESRLEFVVSSDSVLESETLEIYKSEGQVPVEVDEEECKRLAPNAQFLRENLAKYLQKSHLLRHDSEKLANLILQSG